MVLSAYAQKSTSIKVFEYPDYLCPNPYTGQPIYGGNTLAISYSEKKNSWKIQCKLPPKTKRFCPLVLK